MTLNKGRIIPLAAIIVFLFIAPEFNIQINGQEKEKLLFQEIPVVITASRKEQPITEAASTITVISAEDIKYSGATNIPDILRRVAGVDVMTISTRDQQVGVRGFIMPLNNKLLVLLDGRSVYTDLYGTVLWDLFPVGLEEIQRIEVVKSPASSVYGANAYTGVINVITKSPAQLEGTKIRISGGNKNTFIASLIHAGYLAEKKISYKISTEWYRTWQDSLGTGQESPTIFRANAMLTYSFRKKGKFILSAGRSHSQDRKLLSSEYIGTGLVNLKNDYVQLDFQYGRWKFHSFYRSENPFAEWLLTNETQDWHIGTFNAELLHSFNWGKNYSLIWGINYRNNSLKKNSFIQEEKNQNLWALFLENEIKLSKKFKLTGGLRYDSHPLTKGRFSPRGNIIFSPSDKHFFKISVAQAYRNPSFVESYIYIKRLLTLTLPSPLPPLEIPYQFIYRGNPNLKPESVTSFEIGYKLNWSRHIKVDINLFYNQYENFFFSSRTVTTYGENEIFPGSPGGIFPNSIIASFENGGSARGIGGEINFDFIINEKVSGFANYSYLEIKDKDDDPSTLDINETNRIRPENPRHKINGGIRFIFKNGLSLNLLAHWIGLSHRLTRDNKGVSILSPVDDHLLLNCRMGYTFWHKKAEIALAIFNLLNKKQYEYPTDETLPFPNSEPLWRKFTVTAALKF